MGGSVNKSLLPPLAPTGQINPILAEQAQSRVATIMAAKASNSNANKGSLQGQYNSAQSQAMDKQKNFMQIIKDESKPRDVISHQHEESKGNASDKIFSFMDNKGQS